MSRNSSIKVFFLSAFAMAAMVLTGDALAQSQAPVQSVTDSIAALTVQRGAANGQGYSLTVQVLLLITALTLLRAIVLMMTSFAHIVIVLGILRQALGAGQTPL